MNIINEEKAMCSRLAFLDCRLTVYTLYSNRLVWANEYQGHGRLLCRAVHGCFEWQIGSAGSSHQRPVHPGSHCTLLGGIWSTNNIWTQRHTECTNIHTHIDTHEDTQTHMDTHGMSQFLQKQRRMTSVRWGRHWSRHRVPMRCGFSQRSPTKPAIDFIIS